MIRWGLLLPHLGCGQCERCGLPWWATTYHVVDYGPRGRGQFALCNRCWDRTSLDERLAAHRKATQTYHADMSDWPFIEAGVRRETASAQDRPPSV